MGIHFRARPRAIKNHAGGGTLLADSGAAKYVNAAVNTMGSPARRRRVSVAGPAARAPILTVIAPADLDTMAAGKVPSRTAYTLVSPAPARRSTAPCAPTVADDGVTVTGAMYSYARARTDGGELFADAVTDTTPADPAGAVAVTEVDEITDTLLAAVPPNSTVDTDAMPVPESVTVVPPAIGPLDGKTLASRTGCTYVYAPERAAGVELDNATTSTVPAARAGAVTVMRVAVFVMRVPATPPNRTEVAPPKFVPVMTTIVPPAVEPDAGEREVRAGEGT